MARTVLSLSDALCAQMADLEPARMCRLDLSPEATPPRPRAPPGLAPPGSPSPDGRLPLPSAAVHAPWGDASSPASSPVAAQRSEDSSGGNVSPPPGLPPPLGIPSHGSVMHASGRCRPCAWFWKPSGCSNGESCKHCHLCPEGTLKARKKERFAQTKAQKFAGLGGLACLGQPAAARPPQSPAASDASTRCSALSRASRDSFGESPRSSDQETTSFFSTPMPRFFDQQETLSSNSSEQGDEVAEAVQGLPGAWTSQKASPLRPPGSFAPPGLFAVPAARPAPFGGLGRFGPVAFA